MISLSYNLLFTIELLHKFFTDEACTDFVMKPSVKTASVLQGYRVVTRQYAHQLYAGIEENTSGNPTIIPQEGAQFTFFLQLNNPVFCNYTNLAAPFPQNKVYYFTNRSLNISNGKNFLSKPTPYDSSRHYIPGDIATNAAGTTFRALRSHTNILPAPGADWMEVDANSYISENDSLTLLTSTSTYSFSTPQVAAVIEVSGFNPTAPLDYSLPVFSNTITFPNAVASFTLDLRALSPGKYKLKINGDEQMIYMNDELKAGNVFGVIDLYNESTLPDGYRMLDGNTLRSPLYSLFFLNRATIWKFALTSTSGTITDTTGIYQFNVVSPNTISSVMPIPLSEKALNLKLAVGLQEYSPIACASPQRLAKFNNGTDVYDCSEIFLNY